MAPFRVSGPFEIPLTQHGNSRIVTGPGDFWHKAPAHANGIGCYVFAVKAGRGYTPWYVGKTRTTFRNECFSPDKINKYNKAILKYNKGTPTLFFISHPLQAGPANQKQMRQIEVFFTQIALSKNAELLNVRNIRQPAWSIQGIRGGTHGNVSRPTKCLRKAVGLD